MRSRVAAMAALVMVLASLVGHRRTRTRLASTRSEALRMATAAAALDQCLFGAGVPREFSDLALVAHARRVALHPDTPPSWPMVCASQARAFLDVVRNAAPTPPIPRARRAGVALLDALIDLRLPAALTAFREGTGGEWAFGWVPPANELRRTFAPFTAPRESPPTAPASPPRLHALTSTASDLMPVSIAPGSIVAGWNAVAGTLSVLFVEPSRDRVFCRTRDRGVTMACRRFDAGTDAPTWLIGNDGPEALLLYTRPNTRVMSVEAPNVPVFEIRRPLAATLPARVTGDLLHAVIEHTGRPFLTRCARGTPCVFTPLDLAPRRESVMLSTGRAQWWIGVGGPETSPILVARRVDDGQNPMGPLRVRALTSPAALLTSCHAHEAAYVAVTDSARVHLVAVEGEAPPRVLGSFDTIPPPVDLTCDAQGATLVGATHAQGCERNGVCPPGIPLQGFQRMVRTGGELVAVWITRDGGDGMRARHGTAETFAQARAWAVDDDAAHGGVSARDLWLFPVDDHLVLFASAATTAVLWSGDRGERWQSAREPVEVHPMRLGSVR